MKPVQCRMARAALGLGVRDLAKSAGVAVDTIARLERGEALRPRTVDAIRSVLEAEGLEFLDATDESGCGVRLKVDQNG